MECESHIAVKTHSHMVGTTALIWRHFSTRKFSYMLHKNGFNAQGKDWPGAPPSHFHSFQCAASQYSKEQTNRSVTSSWFRKFKENTWRILALKKWSLRFSLFFFKEQCRVSYEKIHGSRGLLVSSWSLSIWKCLALIIISMLNYEVMR